MTDFIIIIIIALIVGGACLYIFKAKKSGVKCIGCPHAKSCSNKQKSKCNSTNCGCH